MGMPLPAEAQDALDSFESMRKGVRELRDEVEAGLPNASPEDLRVCREVLEELGSRLEAAIAASHVAVSLWARDAIEPAALLAAVKEPARLTFEALGRLWDKGMALP